MSWSSRRQFSILLGIIAVISAPVIILGVILFLEKEVSCFDNIQNGDESGVDCGGSCSLVCENEVLDPIVQWQRYFEVSPGRYNAVAYIENQNPSSAAYDVPYSFTLFEGQFELEKRLGTIDIPAKSFIPIIENNLYTGERDANRIYFELGDAIWFKDVPEKNPFQIYSERVVQGGNQPRISAIIKNTSPREIGNINAIVLVYGNYGNLMTFSSTYVDSLDAQAEKELIFTWNEAFPEEVSRIEIIPQYK